MNKLIKPIVFLFVVALSTGAYAQQGKPGKKLKPEMKLRSADSVKRQEKKTVKAILVPNQKEDIQKLVQRQGITVARVK